MALTVGTNSWATVAEADTYFDNRWMASGWASISTANKETLLISAYRWIQAQSLFSISPGATADIIKQAQFEAAWYLYNYSPDHEDRRALYEQGVRDFKISEFEEELEGAVFPRFISDMLEDSIVSGGGTFPTVSRDLP